MWAKLIRQYSNITMVLSGHEVRGAGQDAAGHRMDLGVHGNPGQPDSFELSEHDQRWEGAIKYKIAIFFMPRHLIIRETTYKTP
jgi:hypothetical protein